MSFSEPHWMRAERMAQFRKLLLRLSESSLRQLDSMVRKAERGQLASFDYLAVAQELANLDQADALAELKPIPDDLRRFDHDGLRYQLTMGLAAHDVAGHAAAHQAYLAELRRRRDRHDAMPSLPDRHATRTRLRRRP